MTERKRPVDAVIIGYGWTGAIMAKTLTDAGLSVVALERGPPRDTSPDFEYPRIADELKYGIRGDLWQPLANETVTIRHGIQDTAVPYRKYGSFILGNGVGGAGVHWNGQLWRASPEDLRLRTHIEQRYGKRFIPADMTIQDYPVSFEELEPHFDHFEKVCGVSGIAGNLRGQIKPGGNPFEGPRSDEFPTPPMPPIQVARLFERAAAELGYKSFPVPSANSSIAYTNPYGVRLGPCNLCGFCERFGCFLYSKASPQTTILPILTDRQNLEVRTNSYVTKILMDRTRKVGTGVTYVDENGVEVEQPADMVILSAFQMHNVRLLLLSGIGRPFDPVSGEGLVGKNYAYQMCSVTGAFFSEDVEINPFIGAGAAGQRVIDEFNSDHFDHSHLGFIGGSLIYAGGTGGRPIEQMMLPPDSPHWGGGWKAAIRKHYRHSAPIGALGSVMSYRDRYLSLDPTYKDAHGLPLLRITFDWHDNEYRMAAHSAGKMDEIVRAMKPEKQVTLAIRSGKHYDTRVYQTTHTTGGAIIGSNPTNSVINRYSQSWEVPNLFIYGASSFPQNIGYNPTGLLAGLTYFSAAKIRDTYLKSPGPLVPT
ncbi:MAG: gluconate 2-dehydrogenase alpha chain [Gammaproteobacteria bacterium]|nr:gluconate 2-dehydrogenase alpha chain [Gammaproteobacteria bacterium]